MRIACDLPVTSQEKDEVWGGGNNFQQINMSRGHPLEANDYQSFSETQKLSAFRISFSTPTYKGSHFFLVARDMIRTENVEARALIGMLLSLCRVDDVPTPTYDHNIDLFDRCRAAILSQCNGKLDQKSSTVINLKK